LECNFGGFAGCVENVIVWDFFVLQTDLFASNDAHYFNEECGKSYKMRSFNEARRASRFVAHINFPLAIYGEGERQL